MISTATTHRSSFSKECTKFKLEILRKKKSSYTYFGFLHISLIKNIYHCKMRCSQLLSESSCVCVSQDFLNIQQPKQSSQIKQILRLPCFHTKLFVAFMDHIFKKPNLQILPLVTDGPKILFGKIKRFGALKTLEIAAIIQTRKEIDHYWILQCPTGFIPGLSLLVNTQAGLALMVTHCVAFRSQDSMRMYQGAWITLLISWGLLQRSFILITGQDDN